MSVVKVETTTGVCHGCLSADRRTASPGNYSELYFSLIQHAYLHNEESKLCWECLGTLRRLHTFKEQVRSAQHMLLQITDVKSLSKLTTSNKDGYDYEISETDLQKEEEIITELKKENCHEDIDTTDDVHSLSKLTISNNDDYDYENSETDLQKEEEMITELKKEIKVCNNKLDDDYTKGDPKDNIIHDIIIKEEDITENDIGKQEEKNEIHKKGKRRKKKKFVRLTTKYKPYARIVAKEKVNWGNSLENYFTKVFLGEKEMEKVLERDRRTKSFGDTRYKCKKCTKKGYVRLIDFNRHMDLNHHKPNTPFVCRMCKEEMPSIELLAEHWRQHSPMYTCSMCSEYVRYSMFKRHLNSDHSNTYACCSCKMEFGTLLTFAQHYKAAHDTFICDICGKVCFDKTVFIKHIKHKHGDNSCKTCVRDFASHYKLREHLKLNHPERLNKNINLRELAYCVECDRQFPSVHKYMKHLKESVKHTPKVPEPLVPCPECGKKFARKVYMNNHFQLTHLKMTRHHCHLCNKYYANSTGLKKHNEDVHLKLPKLKDKICDICGRGFHNVRILVNHRRTHTGERPFKCNYCNSSFAQLTAMKSHQRTQHKEYVQQPAKPKPC